MEIQVHIPNTWETEAGRSEVYRLKFKANLGYMSCFKTKKLKRRTVRWFSW